MSQLPELRFRESSTDLLVVVWMDRVFKEVVDDRLLREREVVVRVTLGLNSLGRTFGGKDWLSQLEYLAACAPTYPTRDETPGSGPSACCYQPATPIFANGMRKAAGMGPGAIEPRRVVRGWRHSSSRATIMLLESRDDLPTVVRRTLMARVDRNVVAKLGDTHWKWADKDPRALAELSEGVRKAGCAGGSKALTNYTDLVRGVVFQIPGYRRGEEFTIEDWSEPEDRELVGEFLCLISARNYEDSGCLVSSVIVRDDTNRPGKRFFEWAREIGLFRHSESRDEFWARQVDLTRKYFGARS